MSFLHLVGVEKSYGAQAIVKRFDLSVERGEFVTLLGPSGCGKTTTLRMIAGFERASAGEIRIDGRDVTGLRANQRAIGMVFQSYALFPNMTVAQNIGFGLKVARQPAPAIRARVEEMLAMIRLPDLADRYPYQLSGGQQQRVSLARALAPSPQILLLDEPLSALDARIRLTLREEIRSLQKRLGITTVFVTHDQEEALSLSDRIAVMNEGALEQVGSPGEIYNRPKTRFVATFVGELNTLEAEIVDPEAGALSIGDAQVFASGPIRDGRAGERRTLALRPEAVRPDETGPGSNALTGVLKDVTFLGSVVRLHVQVGGAELRSDVFNSASLSPPQRGAAITLGFQRENLIVLPPA
jgi:putative spermidine/putrescine transport system ATP-binding protein